MGRILILALSALRFPGRVVIGFIGGAAAALLFRGVWLTRRAEKFDTRAENFINRISALLLFTAFTLYLLSWARLLAPMQALLRARNRRYSTAGNEAYFNDAFDDAWGGVSVLQRWCGSLAAYCCEEKKRAACALLNIFVWLVSLSLAVADNARPDMELGKGGLYHGGVLLLAILALLLSLLFLYYGGRLWWKLRTRQRSTFSQKSKANFQRTAAKVLLVSCIVTVCFGIKFLCFLWQPATGNYFPVEGFYPYMFYLVPDVVPVVALLLVLAPPTEEFRRMSKSVFVPPSRHRKGSANAGATAGAGGAVECAAGGGGGGGGGGGTSKRGDLSALASSPRQQGHLQKLREDRRVARSSTASSASQAPPSSTNVLPRLDSVTHV